MKRQRFTPWILLLAVSLVLAACAPTAVPEEAAGFSLPQVWFDAPLPGTVFAPGSIQVVAHAADKTGVGEVELSLSGGQVLGTQVAGQGETLVTAAFSWLANLPGVYTLQVRALSVNGDWSDYAYTDVIISGEEEVAPTGPEATPATIEEPTPTATTAVQAPTATPEACTDRAAFVSETILDGTVFKPGTAFTKTWTLRNAGTCTWTPRYALSFYDGEQMAGPNHVPLTKQVQPGENITFNVDLTAPSQPGTYRGRWMVMNEQGVLFGLGEQGNTAFWVAIVVAREDTRAPSVEVSYSPNNRGEPTGRQNITFTANASDNVKVTKIEVYLAKVRSSSVLLGTCNNQDTCIIEGGPYPTGDYQLQAIAYDAAGNQGSSVIVNFTIYP